MSREYGVEVCSEECGLLVAGKTTWYAADMAVEDIVRDRHENGMDAYCPGCGTRVGIDKHGSWREAMVPRAALEWLAANRHLTGCPAEWHIAPLPCSVDAKCHYEENRERCWMEVAVLKAAKGVDNALDTD